LAWANEAGFHFILLVNNSLIKKPCGFELVHRLITGTQDIMNPKEIFWNF